MKEKTWKYVCVITTVCLTDDLASGTFSNNNHTSDKKGTQKKHVTAIIWN